MSVSLEIFGDRWSLLIVRDMMVRGYATFREFAESGEGIATNVLASRLRRLQSAGIVESRVSDDDRRQVVYRLTEKGIDLAPVLLDLLLWGAKHEETGASCAMFEYMSREREQILTEVRRRWAAGDRTPILPGPPRGGVKKSGK